MNEEDSKLFIEYIIRKAMSKNVDKSKSVEEQASQRAYFLRTFDTFLWRMPGVTGRKIHIGGIGTGEGGHLNYVSIGILMAKFHGELAYTLTPAMVVGWNLEQNRNSKTTRNYNDIVPGIKFSKIGIDLFLEWKRKKGDN